MTRFNLNKNFLTFSREKNLPFPFPFLTHEKRLALMHWMLDMHLFMLELRAKNSVQFFTKWGSRSHHSLSISDPKFTNTTKQTNLVACKHFDLNATYCFFSNQSGSSVNPQHLRLFHLFVASQIIF